jgi:hypothetical protein
MELPATAAPVSAIQAIWTLHVAEKSLVVSASLWYHPPTCRVIVAAPYSALLTVPWGGVSSTAEMLRLKD